MGRDKSNYEWNRVLTRCPECRAGLTIDIKRYSRGQVVVGVENNGIKGGDLVPTLYKIQPKCPGCGHEHWIDLEVPEEGEPVIYMVKCGDCGHTGPDFEARRKIEGNQEGEKSG